jgi:hypothetical protein
VALEESEIGSTDPNIPIDNNCKDDKLHFGMPGCSGDYEAEGDESDDRDRMATMRMRMRREKHCKPIMDQRRIWSTDLGPSDIAGYEGEDGDDVDADEEEEAS